MTAAQQIASKENELKQIRRREKAFAVDGAGATVIERESDADFEITLTDEEVERLKNAEDVVFTHNHPRGWEYPPEDPRRSSTSFSPHDVLLACRAELTEIRAVSPRFLFSMKQPESGWNEAYWSVISLVYDMEKVEVDREMTHALRLGIISAPEYQRDFLHRIWQRTAALFGLHYTRIEEENGEENHGLET